VTIKNKYCMLACSASMLALGSAASAQEDGGLSWEVTLEIGADSNVSSGIAANELTDVYAAFDIAVEGRITDTVSFFAAGTAESVTGATTDRAFEDMGFYIGEIGLSFKLGRANVSIGKISPAFGMAWDTAPGFYGTAFAEDYELAEMLGVSAEFDLGSNGGTIAMAAFFADNSFLSDSIGTKRGRNTTAAGGAGNTGQLNNFAVQWTKEMGDTTFGLGARFLSAGIGDPEDEVGLTAGFTYAVNENFEVIGELAAFKGFGGTTDKAQYATLGGSYAQGDFTYSASYTHRHTTSGGTDGLLALGLDYGFQNGWELNAGYAYDRQGGVNSHLLGVALVIPLVGG